MFGAGRSPAHLFSCAVVKLTVWQLCSLEKNTIRVNSLIHTHKQQSHCAQACLQLSQTLTTPNTHSTIETHSTCHRISVQHRQRCLSVTQRRLKKKKLNQLPCSLQRQLPFKTKPLTETIIYFTVIKCWLCNTLHKSKDWKSASVESQ